MTQPCAHGALNIVGALRGQNNSECSVNRSKNVPDQVYREEGENSTCFI